MALTKILQEGIKDGEIVNADINASAAIATSKISGLATSATTDTTNASNIGSGTLPDGRFPATLPAASAANLTAIPAANITGTLPAISGANLTGIDTDLVSDTSPQLGGTLASNTHDIHMADNDKLFIGTGQDMHIFHDGTNSFITSNNGYLQINAAYNEIGVKLIPNGAVELYYNNSKKLETTSSGVDIAGNCTITGNFRGNDNVKLNLGNGDDLQIYHNGSHSYALNTTGQFILGGDTVLIKDGSNSEVGLKYTANGSVELYYDDTKKLETTSSGATVQEHFTISGTDPRLSFVDTNNDPDFQIWANAQKFAIYDSTNGASRLHINSSGSIGLGTTSPNTNLHIKGSNNGGNLEALRLQNNHTSSGTKTSVLFTNSTSDGVEHAKITATRDNSGRLDFFVGGQSHAVLCVDGYASGVVGVNTVQASFPLDVNGKTRTHGILFGSDTASANTLDDYEEGSFTATMGSSGGGASFNSGATANGVYAKIGGLVYVQMYFGCNIAAAGSGVAMVSGLPFTSNSSSYYPLTITHTTMTVGTVQNGYVQYSGTIFYPIVENGTGGSALSVGNPRYMMIAGCYPAW